jgi:DNA recombination protein RmuC
MALANVMSNNQLRGRWGELQLKRTMEAAGMVHNVDYFTQVQTTNDEGVVIKPDAAINMPDGRFVAVDAKTPFNNYDRAMSISTVGTDEENRERTSLLKKHVVDVKHHIDEISKKNYYSGMPSSPEFTLMFLPSESILSATLEHDPALMEYAFSKRVALVSPVSFFSSVKAIAYTWQQSAQEATVQEIITLGVKLHKNVRVVAEHFTKL